MPFLAGRRPARRLCRPLCSPPGCDNSGGQVPWRCRDIRSKTDANECRGSRIDRCVALPRELTRPLDLTDNRPAQGGSVKPASAIRPHSARTRRRRVRSGDSGLSCRSRRRDPGPGRRVRLGRGPRARTGPTARARGRRGRPGPGRDGGLHRSRVAVPRGTLDGGRRARRRGGRTVPRRPRAACRGPPGGGSFTIWGGWPSIRGSGGSPDR
jgi:hypothetical protein